VRAASKIMMQLYQAFMKSDASLAEINPLVVTPAGEVVALDAKMLDRRQRARSVTPSLAALRDETAEEHSEVEARNANLTFIKLEGDVGCVVNGAGLAMATMDLVKYYGGAAGELPRHRRSSNPEKVVNALRSSPRIRA
jgi:succinyl-CoA synthetase beta subunit